MRVPDGFEKGVEALSFRETMVYGYRWGINVLHRRRAEGFAPRDFSVYRWAQKADRVRVGRGTYGVPTLHMYHYDNTRLIIGNYCSMAPVCFIGGGHPPDRVTTYPLAINLGLDGAGEDGFPAPSKDTVIGSDVYLGQQSVILSGVTIGDGAIVGIAGVVTKDVPPYAIVGGNPARLIRYRFSADQIAALLEIRWWDWSEEEIKRAAPQLTSSDVDAFIEYARQRDPGWIQPAAGVVNPDAPGFEKAPKERDQHVTRRLPGAAVATVAANLSTTA
jgi:acetyltransferase-like isoleucine patch superfamily enzyme